MSGLLTTDINAANVGAAKDRHLALAGGYKKRISSAGKVVKKNRYRTHTYTVKRREREKKEDSLMRARNAVGGMSLIGGYKEKGRIMMEQENDGREIEIFNFQKISGSYEYKNARFDFKTSQYS